MARAIEVAVGAFVSMPPVLPITQHCQGGDKIAEGAIFHDHFNMDKPSKIDVWPQRKRFKELYEAYRKGFLPAKTRQVVAGELGLSDGGLYSLLYDKTRKPGLYALRNASTLFDCRITELLDDPGDTPEGLESTADAVAPEETRVAMRRIYDHLKTMTPGEIQNALRMWDAAMTMRGN